MTGILKSHLSPMKIKNSFAIMNLFFLILIAGCTSVSTGKNQEIDVHTGYQGLVMEFVKNTPPPKVFEQQEFPVYLKIMNSGAYSIKDTKAYINLGVEKDYTSKVTLLESSAIQKSEGANAAAFTLKGKTNVNPNGDEEVISYNVIAGSIDPQSEAHPSAVTAALCYPYQSELSSTICIDSDISNLRPEKKVCQVKDLVTSGGQGAPVAVTKVEISMLPASAGKDNIQKIIPQFLIYVENVGKGLVIRNEAVSNFCTKSETSHEDLNVVYVDAQLSGENLNCQIGTKEKIPGHIKLNDKKDIVRCTLDKGITSSQNAYLSPLKITLTYGYTQTIAANYFIQKLVQDRSH